MNRNFFLKSKECDFHIALYQPDIPPNTGNIARLCVATNTTLHLIKPLGFSLNDKKLKRAGLDYWEHLDLVVHSSFYEFLERYKDRRMFFTSTKAKKLYFDIQYHKGDFFVFGSETQGLPEDFLKANLDRAINIPMTDKVRSLNLADSVAIVLYEAIRQVAYF